MSAGPVDDSRRLAAAARVQASHPTVLPENVHLTVYSGFLPLAVSTARHGSEFRVRVKCPRGPADLRGAALALDPALRDVLGAGEHVSATDAARGEPSLSYERAVLARLKRAAMLDEFLLELTDLIERCVAGEGTAATAPPSTARARRTRPADRGATLALPPPPYYKAVLHEISSAPELGWDKVVRLHDSLTEIELRAVDAGGREHTLVVTLPREYPPTAASAAARPAVHALLPAHLSALEPAGAAGGRDDASAFTLAAVYARFLSVLRAHQPLFGALDDLDRHAWVLEPERPTYAATSRRIAIGRHCSVQLELDTRAPRAVPEWRLLGSEAAVAPLRVRLGQNLDRWDADARTPRENLERVLELAFPPPPATAADAAATTGGGGDDDGLECGICYAYRLEDVGVPDMACDHPQCARPYHRSCLWEWLKALPDSRQSFDCLFGACPYCSRAISVLGAGGTV